MQERAERPERKQQLQEELSQLQHDESVDTERKQLVEKELLQIQEQEYREAEMLQRYNVLISQKREISAKI